MKRCSCDKEIWCLRTLCANSAPDQPDLLGPTVYVGALLLYFVQSLMQF